MRTRNDRNDLEVHAVAGARSVVLVMAFKHRPEGLLGFAFERRDLATGRRVWLEGQKCFGSVVPAPVPGQKYPTHLHPVQSFMWKDFTVAPGERYAYAVTPMFGTPKALEPGDATDVIVEAESEWNGRHGVYFNRGVAGSQAYSEHFPPLPIRDMDPGTRDRAFAWLSRGLYEGLYAFLARARRGDTLHGAFYEFEEPRTLAALKQVQGDGVRVQLVLDGKTYRKASEPALRKVGLLSAVTAWRTKAKIAHNKFLVRCSAAGTPLEVWTGSTNVSEKGFFGQCNTGHVVRDRRVAARYRRYWDALAGNPALAALREDVHALQPDLAAAALPRGVTAFFSPRRYTAMLDVYADLVAGAHGMTCGIFPFTVDARMRLAFNVPKDFPRYVVVDRASETFVAEDDDLGVTSGAAIEHPIDQWVKERSAGSLFHRGTDFVHNKLLVVDPLGALPTIIAGSANFSQASTDANDENMLVIRGPQFRREADLYLTEFIRLYDHFAFRAWLNANPDRFEPFLEEPDPASGRLRWYAKYFDRPDSLAAKRTAAFTSMVIG